MKACGGLKVIAHRAMLLVPVRINLTSTLYAAGTGAAGH